MCKVRVKVSGEIFLTGTRDLKWKKESQKEISFVLIFN